MKEVMGKTAVEMAMRMITSVRKSTRMEVTNWTLLISTGKAQMF